MNLTDELRDLGTVPIPSALLARIWLSILGELSTAHPAEADSPVTPFGGITGHSSSPTPDGPRLRAGVRSGGSSW